MGNEEGRGQSASGTPRSAASRRGLVAMIVVATLALGVLLAGLFVWRRLAPEPARPRPIADVSSSRLLGPGSVVGFASAHQTHAWLGIPYAAPPVGDRRWRAPRPARAWGGTRDALEPGPPCPQPGGLFGGVPAETPAGHAGREDCLHLNVWAPRAEPETVPSGDARWPVMVWLHGGGNTHGWAGSPMYDGAALAGREQVVVVSVGYRLGPLGFFSHPALRAEAQDGREASGNFALLDQIAALEWIRDNVAEFGGDPTNVTLFGESAGGLDVFALLLASGSEGLFHRAIVQSGSLGSVSRLAAEAPLDAVPPGHPRSSAEVLVALLVESGVVPDRSAARSYARALAPTDVRAFLRARDAYALLDVYRDRDDPTRLDVPRPIGDGVLLPAEDWLTRLRSGRFHHVPILAGANRDEWKLFLARDERYVRRIGGVLYRLRDPDDYERRARHHSDLRIVRGVHEPLDAIADSGFDALYAYRFDWDGLPPVLGQPMSKILGAAHGLELPLLFGTFDVGHPLFSRWLYGDARREEREALSAAMMAYWAEFARRGRPGRGGDAGLPDWEPWVGGSGERRWMLLDSPGDGGLRMATTTLTRERIIAAVEAETTLPRAARCALLEELLAEHGGAERGRWRSLVSLRCPGDS